MLGGTCPSPRTFLRNKNVVAFVVENKEDITVAEKMQWLLRLLRQRRFVKARLIRFQRRHLASVNQRRFLKDSLRKREQRQSQDYEFVYYTLGLQKSLYNDYKNCNKMYKKLVHKIVATFSLKLKQQRRAKLLFTEPLNFGSPSRVIFFSIWIDFVRRVFD